MKNKSTYIWTILGIAALIAIIGRLFPHPYNFTPIGAAAIFAGCYLKNRNLALLTPIIMMLITDTLLQISFWMGWSAWPGYHNLMPFIYLGFGLMVLGGIFIKGKVNLASVTGATLGGSLIFFILSNLGVWLMSYPIHSLATLIKCYSDAIPFFQHTLMGNVIYATLFFGAYEWVKRSQQVDIAN